MFELIILDIMMLEMWGDELCVVIKNDIEILYIFIILFIVLNDEKNILEGLKIGVDEYIVKLFNIGILKVIIVNLLINCVLLKSKYVNFEVSEEEEVFLNCVIDFDWKFIVMVKKSVEENIDNLVFNVDVFCNLLNMSCISFYNKLKVLIDQVFVDYIRLICLKWVVVLLKIGQYFVIEIFELMGFNDVKYFWEVFKKYFKVSFSKYCKEGGKEDVEE